MHGLALATMFIGGNVLISGIVDRYRESMRQAEADESCSPFYRAIKSFSIADVILIQNFKMMGFKDDTLRLMQRDIHDIREKGVSLNLYKGLKDIAKPKE